MNDDALSQILGSEETNPRKLQLILNLCDGNTRDNYSGYLIQVANNELADPAKEWIEPMQAMAQNADNTIKFKSVAPDTVAPVSSTPPETPKSNRGLWYLGGLVLISMVSYGIFFLIKINQSQRSRQRSSPWLPKKSIPLAPWIRPLRVHPNRHL